MIQVRTASRLHFGLLSFGAEEVWPDYQGRAVIPARRFGGVGLMVREPGIHLEVQPAAQWSAEGPLSDRALSFARRIADFTPGTPPHHLILKSCAPEHLGLGTGTQLGLAVAAALAKANGHSHVDVIDLARQVGRGARSALGIHGFAHGGFLVDGGKSASDNIAPLVARMEFPASWSIVLILPSWGQGLHGQGEVRAFEELLHKSGTSRSTDSLCRLVLLGMLPALASRDFLAFSDALHDFNARVGEAFSPIQGGIYCHPRSADLIHFLRQQGIRGVGQSSWGPAVFAVTEDEDQAGKLLNILPSRFDMDKDRLVITQAANIGAQLSTHE